MHQIFVFILLRFKYAITANKGCVFHMMNIQNKCNTSNHFTGMTKPEYWSFL